MPMEEFWFDPHHVFAKPVAVPIDVLSGGGMRPSCLVGGMLCLDPCSFFPLAGLIGDLAPC